MLDRSHGINHSCLDRRDVLCYSVRRATQAGIHTVACNPHATLQAESAAGLLIKTRDLRPRSGQIEVLVVQSNDLGSCCTCSMIFHHLILGLSPEWLQEWRSTGDLSHTCVPIFSSIFDSTASWSHL